jgi:DNA-binding response OmpR family regulator
MATIAVIEDVKEDREPIAQALTRDRHIVVESETKSTALDSLSQTDFDVFILDRDLGHDKDAGVAILKAIPEKKRSGVIIVSARDDYAALRPVLLQLGAWDYVVKPVEPEYIVLKVRQLLDFQGRVSGETPQTYGSLSWHPGAFNVVDWKGNEVSIPPKSCEIVKMLARNSGEAVPYRDLLGLLDKPTKQSLRTHIRNARNAFRDVDIEFDAIRNSPGKGYEWSE